MKDLFKVAGIFLGGIGIGAALQSLVDDKALTNQKKVILEVSNKNMELAQQLATAEVINSQVGVYAVALKRQLDEYTN